MSAGTGMGGRDFRLISTVTRRLVLSVGVRGERRHWRSCCEDVGMAHVYRRHGCRGPVQYKNETEEQPQ